MDTIFTFLSVKTKINKNRLNSINLKKLLTATRLSMWLNYFECDAIRTVFQLFWKLHSHNSVLRSFYRKPGKAWKTKTWKSWETFVFRFLLFFKNFMKSNFLYVFLYFYKRWCNYFFRDFRGFCVSCDFQVFFLAKLFRSFSQYQVLLKLC